MYALTQRRGNATVQAVTERERMQQLVRNAALAAHVEPSIALAFAECESNFNPRAEGDLQWPYKREPLYRELVLENPRFRDNPWRADPTKWHSYGLFQLLAPYHVKSHEDPRRLLDPTTNAVRGCAYIARLLEQTKGDVYAARLAYIGCGPDGSRCSTEAVALARAKLRAALARYGGA